MCRSPEYSWCLSNAVGNHRGAIIAYLLTDLTPSPSPTGSREADPGPSPTGREARGEVQLRLRLRLTSLHPWRAPLRRLEGIGPELGHPPNQAIAHLEEGHYPGGDRRRGHRHIGRGLALVRDDAVHLEPPWSGNRVLGVDRGEVLPPADA